MIGRIFNGEMIRALRREDDPKTQTRRIDGLEFINHDPSDWSLSKNKLLGIGSCDSLVHPRSTDQDPIFIRNDGFTYRPVIAYKVGARIWVREAAMLRSVGPEVGELSLKYMADDSMDAECYDYFVKPLQKNPFRHTRWTPSIHMPRWATRYLLEITDVRFERIQDISEDDAAAEGIVRIVRSAYKHGRMDGYGLASTPPEDAHTTRRNAFAHLWDSINKDRGFGWDKNPWVCVIEFKKA